MAKLFCVALLLLLALLDLNEAGRAEFLRSHRRFNDSASYDSYYCCNLCSNFLVWVIDGVDAVRHFASESRLGSTEKVASDPSNAESLRYSSMIVSLRQNDIETCMDVVLLATQNRSDWRPNVICRGANEEYTVQYNETNNFINSDYVSEGALTGRLAFNRTSIVSAGNNYSTGAVICRSNGPKLSWWSNKQFLVGFNGANVPGDVFHLPHPYNPAIAMFHAVIVEKTAYRITSVILGTGLNSADISISCQLQDDAIGFPLIGIKAVVSIPSTTSSSAPDTSYSVQEFPTNSCKSPSPYLMVITVLFGIALSVVNDGQG